MIKLNKQIKLVIDIDNTICTTKGSNYKKSKPIRDRIDIVNRCYDSGFHITFFTARGTTSGKSWRKLTELQLKTWGVKYHQLILGKPDADFFIDDKNLLPEDFFTTMRRRNE